jgi:hypothetical protein
MVETREASRRQFCDRALGDTGSTSDAIEARGRSNCWADAGGFTVFDELSIDRAGGCYGWHCCCAGCDGRIAECGHSSDISERSWGDRELWIPN